MRKGLGFNLNLRALLQPRDAHVAQRSKKHSQAANVVDFDAAALADKKREKAPAAPSRRLSLQGSSRRRGPFPRCL